MWFIWFYGSLESFEISSNLQGLSKLSAGIDAAYSATLFLDQHLNLRAGGLE